MSVMNEPLEGPWHITYDDKAKQLERFSINEFLSSKKDTEAGRRLEGLILDMFPNTAEDCDEDTGC